MQGLAFSLIPRSTGLEEIIAKTKAFAEAAKAPSTRRAYAADNNDFEIWFRQHNVQCLSGPPAPEVIAMYLADRASSLTPQTLTRRLTSINQALRAAGFEGPSPASTQQPLVGSVLRGIRRTKGVAPGPNQKEPLLTEQIRQLIATCGDDLKGIRDRALILVGYASGGMDHAVVEVDTYFEQEDEEAPTVYRRSLLRLLSSLRPQLADLLGRVSVQKR
jgi:site-specific recombinase XerD